MAPIKERMGLETADKIRYTKRPAIKMSIVFVKRIVSILTPRNFKNTA